MFTYCIIDCLPLLFMYRCILTQVFVINKLCCCNQLVCASFLQVYKPGSTLVAEDQPYNEQNSNKSTCDESKPAILGLEEKTANMASYEH